MHLRTSIFAFTCLIIIHLAHAIPLDSPQQPNTNITQSLFSSLEELARIVDISYCVNDLEGISHPFNCTGRCDEFPNFELAETWDTGEDESDSCGYIALDHRHPNGSQRNATGRIIVAFRGSLSVANWIENLNTIPQAYVPFPTNPDANPSPPATSTQQPSPPKEEKKPSGLRKAWNWAKDHVPFLGNIANLFHKKPKEDPKQDPKEDPKQDSKVASGNANQSDPTIDEEGKCANCTVHTGFYESYKNARPIVMKQIEELKQKYPDYDLHLVGHSLGGAVAPFMGLECVDRGWNPTVTSFGAPRIGNLAFNKYVDEKFGLSNDAITDLNSKFRRITHKDDPVPLLPIKEWGYHMHAGEIFISNPEIPYVPADFMRCRGDEDTACSQGMDKEEGAFFKFLVKVSTKVWNWLKKLIGKGLDKVDAKPNLERRLDLWPDRFEAWELLFAHRDYFWRLGLCIPGGDPHNWGMHSYPGVEGAAKQR